jgi:hypothetical protein
MQAMQFLQVRSISGDEEEIRQGQTSQASQPQTTDEGTQKGIPNRVPNQTSVPNPNPDLDPPDPHVFGPSGFGSFCHKAKIVIKTLMPTVL